MFLQCLEILENLSSLKSENIGLLIMWKRVSDN